MGKSDVVEEFYGVYLLKCLNPKYKGRTYIGYTVDPNRRIKQHNKGKLYGGAWRTSQRGPWEMTLTVHGFPSEIAALRFEWAWQHPTKSRRLKTIIGKKKTTETSFEYCLKVMFTMLRIPPWCRLPLTVRWLSAEVMVDPPVTGEMIHLDYNKRPEHLYPEGGGESTCQANLTPPMHMPIVYGPVISKKLKSPKKKSKTTNPTSEEEQEIHICKLCQDLTTSNNSLICFNSDCQAWWHVICLANHFLDKESSFIGTQSGKVEQKNILPVEGCCPKCDSTLLWGDLIRRKKGCYKQLDKIEDSSDVNDDSNLDLSMIG